MKNILVILALSFTFMAFADIDATPGDKTKASATEISSAQACFAEIATFGCGHPRDGQEKFRDCMSNVHGSLKPDCQTMMSDLYGTKK
jgi:hypothetical protein